MLNVDKPLQSALPLIVTIAPALVGLFFGAPLIARELETGTFRLAWTQSVTRRRWLAVKLGLVGLAAMAIGGLLTWMVDWWASPIDAANQNRFDLANFGFHGVAPIGYAAFAFALGATAGVLVAPDGPGDGRDARGVRRARASRSRTGFARTSPRPFDESVSIPLNGANFAFSPARPPNVAFDPSHCEHPERVGVLDRGGRQVGTRADGPVPAPCLSRYSARPRRRSGGPAKSGSEATQFEACVNKLSATFHTVVTYQPGSRFWPFQWAEMGIFLAAALALCGLTYWWLRRENVRADWSRRLRRLQKVSCASHPGSSKLRYCPPVFSRAAGGQFLARSYRSRMNRRA